MQDDWKPVALVCYFEGSGHRPLESVRDEVEAIRQELDHAGFSVSTPRISRESLFDLLTRPDTREHLVLVHFAGHGREECLTFRGPGGAETEVFADTLVRGLAMAPNLHLAFLNCCNSGELAARLHGEAGVPFVVGTSQAVPDGPAKDYASRFYRALAAEENTVALSRDLAETQAGDRMRDPVSGTLPAADLFPYAETTEALVLADLLLPRWLSATLRPWLQLPQRNRVVLDEKWDAVAPSWRRACPEPDLADRISRWARRCAGGQFGLAAWLLETRGPVPEVLAFLRDLDRLTRPGARLSSEAVGRLKLLLARQGVARAEAHAAYRKARGPLPPLNVQACLDEVAEINSPEFLVPFVGHLFPQGLPEEIRAWFPDHGLPVPGSAAPEAVGCQVFLKVEPRRDSVPGYLARAWLDGKTLIEPIAFADTDQGWEGALSAVVKAARVDGELPALEVFLPFQCLLDGVGHRRIKRKLSSLPLARFYDVHLRCLERAFDVDMVEERLLWRTRWRNRPWMFPTRPSEDELGEAITVGASAAVWRRRSGLVEELLTPRDWPDVDGFYADVRTAVKEHPEDLVLLWDRPDHLPPESPN